MQVSLETLDGLERVLTISVPAEKIDSEVDKRIQDYAKKARIDGFRPGKVPVSVVKQKVGPALRNEVVADVMKETMFDAIQEQSLDIAGFPQVEPKVNEPGKPLEYLVKLEVLPEITVADLSGVEIEKVECSVEQGDVLDTIEKMRKQHCEWVSVERACTDEDKVLIDFDGKIDGEKFEGGQASDFELTLGSGQMIPGFEDGIKGMKSGQEKVIEVNFPEDYHHEGLRGKPATFDINLKEVKESKLPDVDEEFFKKFNLGASFDEFKVEVKKTMEKELKLRLLADYKELVTKKLVEKNEIKLPQVMIREEINRLKQQALQQFGLQDSHRIDLSQLPDDMFKEQAEKRVALGLIMSKVIEDKQLKADQDVVRKRIEDMAEAYDNPDEVVKWYFSDPKRVNQIEAIVLEEAVIDEMAKSASIKTVKHSYNEIMNPNKAKE